MKIVCAAQTFTERAQTHTTSHIHMRDMHAVHPVAVIANMNVVANAYLLRAAYAAQPLAARP
jgi:hypothetical protein